MAGEQLLQALAELDRMALLGAGALPVLPRNVPAIGQGDYQGWKYIAWPRASYDALIAAWRALGLYGRADLLGKNAAVAAAMDAGNTIQFAFLRTAAQTVNDVRAQLRRDLGQAGIVAPPATKPASKRFPWAWVLGTAALGLGVGFVLLMAESRNALPGDAP